MMHKFDKFIVDPTVIDHDNMMIEINKKSLKSTMPIFFTYNLRMYSIHF